MPGFNQKEFIIKCLDKLSEILANKDKLDKAIKDFTGGDSDNPRYQSDMKDKEWADKEILDFKAAYFEAIAQVMILYINQNVTIELYKAQRLLEKDYFPKITGKTNSGKRLQSVIENIKELRRTELKDEVRVVSAGTSQDAFFFAGAGAVAVLAAVIAYTNR